MCIICQKNCVIHSMHFADKLVLYVIFEVSQQWLWKTQSSGMWRRVDLGWTDVSDKCMASIFRVEKSTSEEPGWAGGCSLQYPVPDPLLLRKSGRVGNRTRDLWICSHKLWPLDHRGGKWKQIQTDILASTVSHDKINVILMRSPDMIWSAVKYIPMRDLKFKWIIKWSRQDVKIIYTSFSNCIG
jgi:hypothetical protein